MDKKGEIKKLLAKIMDLVEEILDEKEMVDEEAASMAGGDVAGGAGLFGTPPKPRRRGRSIYLPEKKK